jgi:hypothetical protein
MLRLLIAGMLVFRSCFCLGGMCRLLISIRLLFRLLLLPLCGAELERTDGMLVLRSGRSLNAALALLVPDTDEERIEGDRERAAGDVERSAGECE